ncbi:MAG: cytochrome c maturation protein CcmE [Vicinamibacterales bacterium]
MSQKTAKLGITGLVLALAFGGLFYTTLSEGTEYYKHVDEVMASPQEWQGKRLQLHGFVVPKSIGRKAESLEYRFDVHSNGHVVRAYYTGIVPDTFQDEAEVVMKGRLQPDGTFHVDEDGIMAKCPSKYEAQQTLPATTGAE